MVGALLSILLLLLGTKLAAAASHCNDRYPKQDLYDVTVLERDAVVGASGSSLVSFVNDTSDFRFNFNAPWFPSPNNHSNNNLAGGLVVRVVDKDSHPEWANAGAMAILRLTEENSTKIGVIGNVNEQTITWAGAGGGPTNLQVWGAADPRVTFRPNNSLYYLTWDNCTKNCWPTRRTMLSTTKNPFAADEEWTFHGPVFPFEYSSGAALLFRDNDIDTKHLAFVCNSNTADVILVAESLDGLHWHIPQDPERQILMKGRPNCWDKNGVALGPQPERLSSGDYLLVYNIDTGWPYRPNPLGRCAIGWAILDQNDPTQIVARSTKPLLTAFHSWERCDGNNNGGNHNPNCQVPMVVFASGLKPITPSNYNKQTNENEFFLFYGGADSVVAVSRIRVVHKRNNNIINNTKSEI